MRLEGKVALVTGAAPGLELLLRGGLLPMAQRFASRAGARNAGPNCRIVAG